MSKKNAGPLPSPCCSLCQAKGRMTMCESGFVCKSCIHKGREGRDSTTRATKLQQRALRDQAEVSRLQLNGAPVSEELEYRMVSSGLMAQEGLKVTNPVTRGAGGEVIPQDDAALRDTLMAPDAAALDASAHRLGLVSRMGSDVTAMALDAAETIGASNSLERMFSHQLAMLHNSSMEMVAKSAFEQNPIIAMRMLNLGIRAAEAFQQGAVNIKKLRGGIPQVMRIEHVHIAPGAQAILGPVQTGGTPQ